MTIESVKGGKLLGGLVSIKKGRGRREGAERKGQGRKRERGWYIGNQLQTAEAKEFTFLIGRCGFWRG